MTDKKIAEPTLLAAVDARTAENANLTSQLTQAEDARKKAMADLATEVDRVAGLEKSHQETVDSLTAQVKTLASEVETYRTGTEAYKKQIDAQAASAC